MVFMPSGIVIDVRDEQPLKAFVPIETTGYPPNIVGIVTAPPAPVYPVIVAKPLLTVKVKSPSCSAAILSVPTMINPLKIIIEIKMIDHV